MHNPKNFLRDASQIFRERHRLEFAHVYTFRGLDAGGRTADDHANQEIHYEHAAIFSPL
jgi:hypothetical protein